MKKIVKGNDFTLKIPVMKMVDGTAKAFPLPACTDIVVQVCIQFIAFLGCAGLCFVGFAPNYCDRDAYSVHKSAAIVASAGCVGWCLSVCWWITFVIAILYTIYIVAIDFFKVANNFWYIGKDVKFHPWYWMEIAGFADVFLTYLFVELFII